MSKKDGSWLRSVTQKRNQGRFPVTLGYTKSRYLVNGHVNRLHNSVPGYVWLHKSVTQPGSRLRMVT